MTMKIVCREIDKYEGRPPVHYIVCHEPTARDISFLKMRGVFNPELQYYATRLDETKPDDIILKLFEQAYYRKEPYFIRL